MNFIVEGPGNAVSWQSQETESLAGYGAEPQVLLVEPPEAEV